MIPIPKKVLESLDLSNLEMVVFCGGETLMGNAYWQVAEAIADMCPHSKEKTTLSFQTNGHILPHPYRPTSNRAAAYRQ